MKESELDLKLWMRDVLENEYEQNRLAQDMLTTRNVRLRSKIQQIDVSTDDLIKSFKEQLNQAELGALLQAMRNKGTNDQVYLAIATTIHIRAKIDRDVEHVVKLPKRHLVMNTSQLFYHFYYFPYKYRIEKSLLKSGNLESWFSWILTMLMNEFKM